MRLPANGNTAEPEKESVVDELRLLKLKLATLEESVRKSLEDGALLRQQLASSKSSAVQCGGLSW